MNDFIKEGVKVGDRLYSTSYGWGSVNKINMEESLPIKICWDFREYDYISRHGQMYTVDNYPQSVFWDEPKFEIPAKPKREVVKEIDMFVNYSSKYPSSTDAYASEDEADQYITSTDIRCKGKLIFTILE